MKKVLFFLMCFVGLNGVVQAAAEFSQPENPWIEFFRLYKQGHPDSNVRNTTVYSSDVNGTASIKKKLLEDDFTSDEIAKLGACLALSPADMNAVVLNFRNRELVDIRDPQPAPTQTSQQREQSLVLSKKPSNASGFKLVGVNNGSNGSGEGSGHGPGAFDSPSSPTPAASSKKKKSTPASKPALPCWRWFAEHSVAPWAFAGTALGATAAKRFFKLADKLAAAERAYDKARMLVWRLARTKPNSDEYRNAVKARQKAKRALFWAQLKYYATTAGQVVGGVGAIGTGLWQMAR